MTSKKFDAPENWTFDRFTSMGGSSLRYGFAAPAGESRGTVVITGGYGRHIEYYFEKINNWLDRGYTVYAMDWHGQGGSGRDLPDKPDRPSAKDFDHHIGCFHHFVTSIVKPDPDKPAFLSSHSKGGNIMLRYLHRYEKLPGFPFCGAILGAPMVYINTSPLPRTAFRKLVDLLHDFGLAAAPLPSPPKLLLDFIDAVSGRTRTTRRDSEREAVHEGYKARTQSLEIGFPTVGWLRAALRSCETVINERFLRAITTPVLILSAENDGLVCVKSQTRAAHLLANGRQEIFAEARHGIWYDIDDVQNRLWRVIDDFRQPLERSVARAAAHGIRFSPTTRLVA